jgi:hypothetical protein
MQYRTFRFHKILGNYCVAIQLVASRVVLGSVELAGQALSLVALQTS